MVEKFDDIKLTVNCEIGEAEVTLFDLKHIGEGSIITTKRKINEPLVITINGKRKFTGEVVVIDDEYYGYRITGDYNEI